MKLLHPQESTSHQCPDPPGNLNKADLVGISRIMVKCHQRIQHAHRHNEECTQDRKGEQPRQAVLTAYLRESLLRLFQQPDLLGPLRIFRIRDRHEQ